MSAPGEDDGWAARGSCQRCDRSYVVRIPELGSRSGFGTVRATFRYCPGCQRHVGRACCWAPDAVACVDCAVLPAATDERAGSDNAAIVRSALEQMDTTTAELQQRAARLADGEERRLTVEAWQDAWLETGVRVVTVESCRDAAGKRLRYGTWAASDGREPLAAALELATERAEQAVAAMRRALALTGQRLPSGTLESTRSARRRPSRMPALMLVSLVVAVAGLAVGLSMRAVTLPSSVAPSGSGAHDVPTVGATMTPVASATTTSSPEPIARPPVRIGFDDLRIGPATSDGPLIVGEGAALVVAFPSAFDRSLEIGGPARSSVCLIDAVPASSATLHLDLYLAGAGPPPALSFSLMTPDEVVTLGISGEGLSGVAPAVWHRLAVRWTGGGGALTIADGLPRALTATQPAPEIPADAAACLHVESLSAESPVLVDNLMLER